MSESNIKSESNKGDQNADASKQRNVKAKNNAHKNKNNERKPTLIEVIKTSLDMTSCKVFVDCENRVIWNALDNHEQIDTISFRQRLESYKKQKQG